MCMMVRVLVGIGWCLYMLVRVHVYVDVSVHVYVGTCLAHVGVRWYMYMLVRVRVHVGFCVDTCEETDCRGKLIKSMTSCIINW